MFLKSNQHNSQTSQGGNKPNLFLQGFSNLLMLFVFLYGCASQAQHSTVEVIEKPIIIPPSYKETQGFVTTEANQDLHYITGERTYFTEERKPLLLFIHGAPERAEVWKDYMQRYSREYFTVAYNSRGYYPSSIPTDVDAYDLEALAKDAVDIAAYFGYEKFTVVGHDWGAATAWRIAMNYPDAVEKLVIFSNPHPIMYSRGYYESAKHRELLDAYIPLARNDIAPWTREGTLANNLAHYKNYVYTDAAKNAVPWSLALQFEETWTYDNGASLTGIYNHYKALDWPLQNIPMCDFMVFSLAVEQPVLLFYGEQDRFVSSEVYELPNNDCNPNTTHVKFPGGDHFIHHVYKREIFREMDKFL